MEQSTNGGSGTNTILIVMVIIILLVGGYFLFADELKKESQNDGGINIELDFPNGDEGEN